MVANSQEYIINTSKVPTKIIEVFCGLALKFFGKQTNLFHSHCCCKTNMTVCHKNLSPIWKIVCLCEIRIDIPMIAISAILVKSSFGLRRGRREIRVIIIRRETYSSRELVRGMLQRRNTWSHYML